VQTNDQLSFQKHKKKNIYIIKKSAKIVVGETASHLGPISEWQRWKRRATDHFFYFKYLYYIYVYSPSPAPLRLYSFSQHLLLEGRKLLEPAWKSTMNI